MSAPEETPPQEQQQGPLEPVAQQQQEPSPPGVEPQSEHQPMQHYHQPPPDGSHLQAHVPPPEQGHYEQQLMYATGHDAAVQQQLHAMHQQHPQEQQPSQPLPGQPAEEANHQEQPPPQAPPAMGHDPNMQPHTAGLAMPHPVTFAQQLMDPNLSQQQLAQYHQQMAHFHPHAYQQYHPGHLQDVSPLYFAPGNIQLQYHPQDPNKPPDMTVDEAAAVHLTALRTMRQDGQLPDGQQAVAMGQPPIGHPQMQGIPAEVAREGYIHPNPQAVMAATSGRVPSKRKAWRASHEGEGGESGDATGEGGRARRKQTRRPDRLCHHEGCFVTPTYNYPNEKKRIFCVTHKLEGMVNVVAKRCAHADCTVNPRFNYEGQTRGMYCSEHKLDGMVNVIDRRCQEPDCKKFPSHNYPGSHKKLYCATHKKEGMVDMSHGSS